MNIRTITHVLGAAACAAALALGMHVSAPAGVRAEVIGASPWVQLHAARARLIGSPLIAPQRTYLAGLQITLDDGWKTYWRMPGDAGVPPSFDWAGSTNVGAVKVLYPAPTRMPEAGGQAVAYKQSVTFPIEVSPRNSVEPVDLKLALEVGICREICVPAQASLSVRLSSAAQGAPAPEVAAALQQVPRSAASRRKHDPELKRVTPVLGDTKPHLVVEASFPGGAAGADLFIEAPDGLYVPLPSKLSEAGDSVRFEVPLSRDLVADLKAKVLKLTLVSKAGATEAEWTFP